MQMGRPAPSEHVRLGGGHATGLATGCPRSFSVRNDEKPLFYTGDLRSTLEGHRQKAVEAIAALKPDYLMNVSEQDLIESLTKEYFVTPIELHNDKKCIEGPREVDITYEGHHARFRYASEGMTVRGTAVTVVIPFSGDKELFKLRPPTFDFSSVYADVTEHEVRLDFRGTEMTSDQIKTESNQAIASIEKHIAWQRPTLDDHNSRIGTVISGAIAQRKAKLLKDMEMVASLGIPIRHREMPSTFAVPNVRRKPKVELPEVPPGPFKPEPVLADDQYEFILKVIQDMAMVMERSPTAFHKMEEEHLRDHFLVQLNGHFEGAATGETFNYQGKTDILIRHKGRNVFIAECKFWRGEKGFTDTIDQLLGYTSWRDTKTAIILFNRNKNLSAVLGKMPELVRQHANFKRETTIVGETRFRAVFHHRDDKNRELVVTVLVFDIPVPEAAKPE